MFENRKEVNRQSDIVITESVINLAFRLGLCDQSDDYEKSIREILWLSVPTKHRNGNKRYKDWVFTVKRNILMHIHLVDCLTCDDSKRLEVYDECDLCDGQGCEKCNGGLRKGTIPCPTCSVSKKLTNYN